MQTINIILLYAFVIDIFFTYYNVNRFRKKFPEKDFTLIELNPIAKFFWKRFGLLLGGVISTIIALIIVLLFVLQFTRDLKLILIGIYFVILLTHFSNFFVIRRKDKKKKIEFTKFRKYFFVFLIVLTLVDSGLTYNYVHTWKDWQPDRPFSDMEQSPLILLLFNNLPLFFAIILNIFIFGFLEYIVIKEAGWFVIISFTCALVFGTVLNIIHTQMLYDLIKQYPLGRI